MKTTLAVGGVVLVALAIAACRPPPKTRAEFVNAVRNRQGPTVHETFVSANPIALLEDSLRDRSAACLSKTVKRISGGSRPSISSTTYLPEVSSAAGGRVEFTLKISNTPRGTMEPPDGMYLIAADLMPSGDTTAIELFAPSFGYSSITDALRSWLTGKAAACPELQ